MCFREENQPIAGELAIISVAHLPPPKYKLLTPPLIYTQNEVLLACCIINVKFRKRKQNLAYQVFNEG